MSEIQQMYRWWHQPASVWQSGPKRANVLCLIDYSRIESICLNICDTFEMLIGVFVINRNTKHKWHNATCFSDKKRFISATDAAPRYMLHIEKLFTSYHAIHLHSSGRYITRSEKYSVSLDENITLNGSPSPFQMLKFSGWKYKHHGGISFFRRIEAIRVWVCMSFLCVL